MRSWISYASAGARNNEILSIYISMEMSVSGSTTLYLQEWISQLLKRCSFYTFFGHSESEFIILLRFVLNLKCMFAIILLVHCLRKNSSN